ncbi:MAG: hypothetical protein WDN08_15225 [Rhizomicrobium sp.]
MPPTIHVAGTNGKGSACAFSRAMLEAQGLKVHMHISPHLVRFHERIRIAGELISEDELTATLEEVERVNDGRPITYFEITTRRCSSPSRAIMPTRWYWKSVSAADTTRPMSFPGPR